jgi:hypothetical protein
MPEWDAFDGEMTILRWSRKLDPAKSAMRARSSRQG